MKLALYILFITTSLWAIPGHKDCPQELIRHLESSGSAGETIRLVDKYLDGVPNCGKYTRPLITYYGNKKSPDDLRLLIEHFGWGIDLDGQINHREAHTLHLAAENQSPRSDEIFWLLLSTESAMDPLNRISGLTPLITIPMTKADLSVGSVAFKKIYISLAWGANPNIRGRAHQRQDRHRYHNVDFVNAVIRNTSDAEKAQRVLNLLFDRERYFTPEFVLKAFADSYYKRKLAQALNNSAYVPIQPDSFCSQIFSPSHHREINTFEYLRSLNSDYGTEMLAWIESKGITQSICQ